MLNIYQKHVLIYFKAYAPLFVHDLLINQREKFTCIDDPLPLVVSFLDRHLKSDIKPYTLHSIGYEHHVNMLIEIHLPVSDTFRSSLLKELSAAFHQ